MITTKMNIRRTDVIVIPNKNRNILLCSLSIRLSYRMMWQILKLKNKWLIQTLTTWTLQKHLSKPNFWRTCSTRFCRKCFLPDKTHRAMSIYRNQMDLKKQHFSKTLFPFFCLPMIPFISQVKLSEIVFNVMKW